MIWSPLTRLKQILAQKQWEKPCFNSLVFWFLKRRGKIPFISCAELKWGGGSHHFHSQVDSWCPGFTSVHEYAPITFNYSYYYLLKFRESRLSNPQRQLNDDYLASLRKTGSVPWRGNRRNKNELGFLLSSWRPGRVTSWVSSPMSAQCSVLTISGYGDTKSH